MENIKINESKETKFELLKSTSEELALQNEAERVKEYIFSKMSTNFFMLFEVHMDSWIIDMLEITECYKDFFETHLYYGRFIEIMEEHVVHPDDALMVGELFSMSRLMHKLTKHKGPYDFTLRCKYDDTYRWCLFRFAYLATDNGAGKMIVLQQDIDHSVSKEKNQKRQQSFINMLSNRYDIAGLVSLNNCKYELFRNNHSLDSIFQHLNYEVVMEDYLEHKVNDEEADKIKALLRRENLLKYFKKNKQSIEYIYRENDGKYIKLYVIPVPYFTTETPDVIVTFENVTAAMKEKEKELVYLEQEAFMMNIIQNDYLFLININLASGNYIFQEFQDGKECKKICGRKYEDIVKENQIRKWKKGIAQIIQTYPIYQLILHAEHKQQNSEKKVFQVQIDNMNIWLESKVFFFQNIEKSATILVRDITSEMQTQNLIKAQNDVLRNALQEAKSASDVKSNFLSNMSHDIRTPMNAILGMTNVAIKNHMNPEKVLICLQNILQSTRQMTNIVNNILDMSQISNQELELHVEEYRMTVLLHEVECVVQKLCLEKKIICNWKNTGIVHDIVRMDVTRLRQVILNIAMNAVEFTPEGGKITIEVSEKKGIYRNAHYLFQIKDTGIGMSEKFLKQMFQPFEQEMSTLSDRNEGAGLGLTITKYIISKMGGQINVNSAVGEGTTVLIAVKFPIVKALDNKLDGENNRFDIVKKYPGKRILIVEDKKMNIQIIKELLLDSEIIFEEAHNGQEAVEMIKNQEMFYYDLIFMDIRMPILKGDEATKIIRNIKRDDCRKIPIVAMTANVLEADINKAMQSGMTAYLTKPIELVSVYNILDTYLTKTTRF